MNIWIVREHEYGALRIFAYTTREKAESHLRKYLAARIRDCGKIGDYFERSEEECVEEMYFDDGDSTWCVANEIEIGNGKCIEFPD